MPEARYPADPALSHAAGVRQQQALHTARHIWVSANAGTGKTTVLTRRMLALLLVDPALEPRQLLALTFTRAAAAEMTARFQQLLTLWLEVPPEALAENLCNELGLEPARLPEGTFIHQRLAQIAAQTHRQPPLITTLHGFAQQILQAAPAAAGFPAGFDLMDDAAQKRLLRQVQLGLLADPPAALEPFLNVLVEELSGHSWQGLLKETLQNWWKLDALLDGNGVAHLPEILARLDAALALPPEDVIWAPIVPDAAMKELLGRVLALPEDLKGAGLKYLENRARIATAVHGSGPAQEEAWLKFLLTKKHKSVIKNPLTSAVLKQVGEEVAAQLAQAGAEVFARCQARRAWRGRRVTEGVLVWASQVQAVYQAHKQRRGLLDFTDLMDGLQRLLHGPEAFNFEWLWHLLDRRIRHLLLDEAQDNNAQQAGVVAWLAKLLLEGEVGGNPRTVLAVGDVKQSIFRFQGAVPRYFLDLRSQLREWAGPQALDVPLTHTFRNGPHVLEALSQAFADPLWATLLQGENAPFPPHQTVFASRPSRVEWWPLETLADVQPPAAQPPAGRWLLAEERHAARAEKAKQRCLSKVADWVMAQHAAQVVLPSTNQPLRWQDVMIVTQTRAVGYKIGNLLRARGVPVAAPRGVAPPVVWDMAALLRVVLNRTDNLALAQVLKGLEGWNDAQLEALGLAAQAAGSNWHDQLPADGCRVAAFLHSLPEPLAPPAALIQRAVAWWNLELRTFVPLLGWAETAAEVAAGMPTEALAALVQRLETMPDELPVAVAPEGVKILTVQGAKGLQAPLVILPDIMRAANSPKPEQPLWGEGVMLARSVGEGGAASELEARLRLEEQRLMVADSLRSLYVALTRASDWLVVAGWQPGKGGARRAGTEDEAEAE